MPYNNHKGVYDDETLCKMYEYIREYESSHPSYLGAYALELQILTGTRRGEIPPLTWSDVNKDFLQFKKEQLTVKKNGHIPEHFKIVGHTKTRENRIFPMTDDLSDFFKRLSHVHEEYYPNREFLFPADNENGCITNNVTYNFFRRMCEKLNIPIDKEFIRGTHSFRRNAITHFVRASNGNTELAAKIFGNSPEVIRKHYDTDSDIPRAKEVMDQRVLDA